jgi:hypothetical protein
MTFCYEITLYVQRVWVASGIGWSYHSAKRHLNVSSCNDHKVSAMAHDSSEPVPSLVSQPIQK